MVVDHVFNLPRPVYDNALQVLYEILEIEIRVKKGWKLRFSLLLCLSARSFGSCKVR